MTIKHSIKDLLFDLGLWYPIDRLSQRNAVRHWLSNGMTGPAPAALKYRTVRSYLVRYSLANFVETGTYEGGTLGYIAKTGVTCTSIELSESLHARAKKKFRKYPNVQLIQGDSAEQLPNVLATIDCPTLFWLDGHYSAGTTARGKLDTPISEELQAILAHPVQRHVILIDDARCFNGQKGYPELYKVLKSIVEDTDYHAEVSADIVRITPDV